MRLERPPAAAFRRFHPPEPGHRSAQPRRLPAARAEECAASASEDDPVPSWWRFDGDRPADTRSPVHADCPSRASKSLVEGLQRCRRIRRCVAAWPPAQSGSPGRILPDLKGTMCSWMQSGCAWGQRGAVGNRGEWLILPITVLNVGRRHRKYNHQSWTRRPYRHRRRNTMLNIRSLSERLNSGGEGERGVASAARSRWVGMGETRHERRKAIPGGSAVSGTPSGYVGGNIEHGLGVHASRGIWLIRRLCLCVDADCPLSPCLGGCVTGRAVHTEPVRAARSPHTEGCAKACPVSTRGLRTDQHEGAPAGLGSGEARHHL